MRAYRVEDRVFARRTKALSIPEARKIAERLFEVFDVPAVHIRRSRGGGSGYYPAQHGREAVISSTVATW